MKKRKPNYHVEITEEHMQRFCAYNQLLPCSEACVAFDEIINDDKICGKCLRGKFFIKKIDVNEALH